MAVAAYIATRNGTELKNIKDVLEKAGFSDVVVNVDQQAGGTRTGDIDAETDRDVNISGGNITKGES